MLSPDIKWVCFFSLGTTFTTDDRWQHQAGHLYWLLVLASSGVYTLKQYKLVELAWLFFEKLINVVKKLENNFKNAKKKSKVAENFKSCRKVAEQLVVKPKILVWLWWVEVEEIFKNVKVICTLKSLKSANSVSTLKDRLRLVSERVVPQTQATKTTRLFGRHFMAERASIV